MTNRIASNIALIIVLALIAILVVFPILPNTPFNQFETKLLSGIAACNSVDLASVFMKGYVSLSDNIYIYFTKLIVNFFPDGNQAFILRFTGASIISLLTVCLFNFNGNKHRLNASFLAALLFLTCALTAEITFHASPIIIPAATLIFALMSLFHWLNHLNRRFFTLLMASCALSTMLIGVIAPLILLFIAILFISASNRYSFRSYFAAVASLLFAVFIAFISLYCLIGDKDTALQIFSFNHLFTTIFATDSTIIFINYLLFAVFPWSIPLIISSFWFAKNPRETWRKFTRLSLLEQFGLTVFVITIPLLFVATPLSLIMIIASMFFNMPLIGRYLLSQFSTHPTSWRITGLICAAVVGIVTLAFITLKSITSVTIFGYDISIVHGWSFWSVFVLAWIVVGLYQLWRNKRDITVNNRYLYNIITLYLSAVILYFGFINGQVSITAI